MKLTSCMGEDGIDAPELRVHVLRADELDHDLVIREGPAAKFSGRVGRLHERWGWLRAVPSRLAPAGPTWSCTPG